MKIIILDDMIGSSKDKGGIWVNLPKMKLNSNLIFKPKSVSSGYMET